MTRNAAKPESVAPPGFAKEWAKCEGRVTFQGAAARPWRGRGRVVACAMREGRVTFSGSP